MSEYERTLDYELELMRSLDGSTEEAGEDRAIWAAFNEAYFAALRQLVTTMAPGHVEMVLNEIVYALKSAEETERLVKEGKAYGSYSRYAKYPFKLPSQLTLKVKEMCYRHALGDERPLALPLEVAQLYLTKWENGVLLGEFECADCGVEMPVVERASDNWKLEKLACCPVCGSSLEWWPGKSREREAWSKANPEKAVDVHVWPNGSANLEERMKARFKGQV